MEAKTRRGISHIFPVTFLDFKESLRENCYYVHTSAMRPGGTAEAEVISTPTAKCSTLLVKVMDYTTIFAVPK